MNLNFIFGRDTEFGELRQLLACRRPLLLHGPTGAGKTLLIRRISNEAPKILYCGESSSSQTVFRNLAAALHAEKNQLMITACGKGGLNTIKNKSAVSLRGIVTEALSEGMYSILLDHLHSPSHSFATVIKDIASRASVPITAVARSEHMEDVGFLMPMFSDRSTRYGVRNFKLDIATEFASEIAKELQLKAENCDEAIEKIVNFSKGNPGAIVAMLKMATSPKYVAHRHVKLSPLYVDFRMSWGAISG